MSSRVSQLGWSCGGWIVFRGQEASQREQRRWETTTDHHFQDPIVTLVVAPRVSLSDE